MQTIVIKASTEAMKKAKEKPVTTEVAFPESMEELIADCSPWDDLGEMFRDAVAHKIVKIQVKMREALESGEEVTNGSAKRVNFKF